jgi:ABC-type phosphate/phosphonate transport system substrate-binding protein
MKHIYLIILISVILQGSFPSSSCPSITGDPKLYFFNPESSQSNLGRLKREMEKFFDQSGYPVNFQAFAYQTDFDAKIREQQPKFLFAPVWYIEKHGRELKIKPFLTPVYRGTTTYRMVLLVAKSSRITMNSIEDHSLAMTSVGPDSRTFLNHVLFLNHFEETCPFHPVFVPKPADALFALFLGHVDSALVGQDHLKTFKKILPRIVSSVRPLLVSKPIPMPMLCYSEGLVAQTEVERFKTVFLGEDTKRIRNKLSELLQIDDWQEIAK